MFMKLIIVTEKQLLAGKKILFEISKNANILNDRYGLYISKNRGSFVDFYLFDADIKPIGQMVIDKIKADVYTVRWIWAIEGNGSFMYSIAMEYIYPNYLTADKEIFSNDKVTNIYRKLYNDNNIEKREISDAKFHRKYDDKEKEFLVNLEYRLKSKTNKLQRLLANGEQILKLYDVKEPDKFLWDRYFDVTGY